jgi:hypothetical protein
MLADKLRSATAGEKLYVDDVFGVNLSDGTGTTRTAVGPDMTKGGLVITKARSTTTGWRWVDTVRGAGSSLESSSTAAAATEATGLTSFTSTGASFGADADYNASGQIFVDYLIRKAPKFFDVQTISHTNGTATNIDLSSLGTLGTVIAKITDTTGDWITWHRSLTAGNNLRLNTSAAQTTTNAWLSVSGTTATLASTAPTGTYVIYAFAHDTATDGMIQCGIASSTGTNSVVTVDFGWEPQWILRRRIDSTANTLVSDTMGGLRNVGFAENSQRLVANLTNAEGIQALGGITATGLDMYFSASSAVDIYIAIRRPNKPPTTGTQVFNPTVYTGTNVDNRLINTGILTDMVWLRQRNGSGAGYEGFVVGDRLRGQPWLKTGATQVEQTVADGLDQQLVSSTEYGTAFSSMNGVWVGNNSSASAGSTNVNANTTASNHVALAFKRAPGFFDMVAYTGTGANRTVPHNLGAVPELMIVKAVSASGNWPVYYGDATDRLRLNTNALTFDDETFWNDTPPTSSVFTLGTVTEVNGSGVRYIAYLFATLPGISKVGTYTGSNTTNRLINCGFTTGARFVMIKQISGTSTNDWFVFDSARGFSSAVARHLFTNGTAAESTSSTLIDPDSSGFRISQLAGDDLNVSGGTYLFLAIA